MGVCNLTLMMGDFNATPNTLGPIQELIREDLWTDVGHRATWRGGISNHWTCHTSKKARRTRVDGVVVDCETLATIHKFEVEKRTGIPTHCVLTMEMSKNPLTEKRTFLQKLGSLKRLLEEKIKEITKDMDEKEKNQRRGEEIKKAKAMMAQVS